MLAKTPPMGFNTWNTFGENISDKVIRELADAIIDKGLDKAGYEYLVIDDCWSERERDPVTGKIVPSKEKFPEGMKAVSDYVHSKGLKFGMYSCDGTRTCADYPGSFDHEFLDAETFAEYGADFLKYDNCYRPEDSNGPYLYRRMGLALKACGREILFSACNWGCDEVHKWIRSAGAHMYRSTGDINDSWISMRDIALSQKENLCYSAPGCFNDVDMLTCGMHNEGNVSSTGCTDEEYRTEFALWCMYSAPLMLGSDIRKMDDTTLKLVTNKTLIRINQDEEARPPFIRNTDGGSTVFFKHLSNNEFALLFVNFDDCERWGRVYFDGLGIPADTGYGLDLTDAYTGEHVGVKKEFWQFRLAGHDSRMYIGTLSK